MCNKREIYFNMTLNYEYCLTLACRHRRARGHILACRLTLPVHVTDAHFGKRVHLLGYLLLALIGCDLYIYECCALCPRTRTSCSYLLLHYVSSFRHAQLAKARAVVSNMSSFALGRYRRAFIVSPRFHRIIFALVFESCRNEIAAAAGVACGREQ